MEISIIIPVYNAASYLERAMESLIKISIKEVQFICVDDGSTDCSPAILNEYASKDERFITIGQEHQGVSAARNRGLAAAEGTYIMFMDADDCFVLENMNRIKQYLDEGTDIFLFPHIMCTDGKEERCLLPTVAQCKNVEELKKAAVESKEINSVWGKVYRRKVITEHKLFFRQGIKMGEDLIFNLQYLCCIRTFMYCNAPLYVYHIHDGSVTTSFDNSRFRDLLEVYKEMEKDTDRRRAATVFVDDFLFYIIIGLKFSNLKNVFGVLCRPDIIEETAGIAQYAGIRKWYKGIFVFLLRRGKMRAIIRLYYIRFLIVDFLRRAKIIR